MCKFNISSDDLILIPQGEEYQYYLDHVDPEQKLIDDEYIKWMSFAFENDIPVHVEYSGVDIDALIRKYNEEND